MLLTRRAPHDIARPNFLFWTSLALHPATPGRDDQCLPERMDVPCSPSAGLERDADAEHACRLGCLEQGVITYSAGKILVRPLPEGCEPSLLMSISLLLHLDCLLTWSSYFPDVV